MQFIYGLILGVLISLALQWGIKRIFGTGGHNKNGIENALKRERVLQDRIEYFQGELRGARSQVSESRGEISDLRARIGKAEDRVRITDSLVERIKKDNNLE